MCWAAVLLVGCAAPEEPLTHNDPSRYTVASNVHWSAPEGFDLSMDIYTPRSGKASFPVLVIFHGGGWLINDKSIMEQAAKYMVSNGEYVVCNVDDRLLGDQGNTVTLNEIVNDAFGAVLWVKKILRVTAAIPGGSRTNRRQCRCSLGRCSGQSRLQPQ